MHPRKGGYEHYPPHTQPAVVISYWSVVTFLSSLFLMGGIYFSFRISLEVSGGVSGTWFIFTAWLYQVCQADQDKCRKEKFQLAQALRESQGKLHATTKEKIVAMEENLAGVKHRKDCEGQVVDLMKELRDAKAELVDKNIQIREANKEIIELREKLMEIPNSMYID